MRYFYLPTKDAAIYSNAANRNTGLDEILEVGKTNSGSTVARSLLEFDVSQLSGVPINAQYDLTLWVAKAQDLRYAQQIEVSHVSQSWIEGTGYYYQTEIQANDGVTWRYASSGSAWAETGSSYLPAEASASLASDAGSITFDVTTMVAAWISSSVPTTGVILKFPSADEDTIDNKGNIKFFSKDTHTIYQPRLIAKWDDSTYSTGSLSAAATSELSIVPILKSTFRVNEMARVDLAVREKYPQKTYATQFTLFDGESYLPTSSYYSIRDVQSNVTIIPFSDESKISCSPSGSFFRFKVQQMHPLRYYQVLVKIDRGSEDVEFYECKPVFKVTL